MGNAPGRGGEVAALRRALTSIRELRARLDEVERAKREPIAVIGLGCRFPGGVDSPESYWDLLVEGRGAIREVPPDRWPAEQHGATARWGGFLDRADLFDAGFFGIPPREANRMDPQQRLILETAYEALEDAGQSLDRLAGGEVGVFIGVHSHSSDYALLQWRDLSAIGAYTGTGTAHSIIANRLSYCFDWQGPSVAVDTACSSSLVAVHMAVRSLRNRECGLALAGGVNLMLLPEMTVTCARMQILSSGGRCRTFDADADGTVRGEGCGLVVLKRLSDALADRDPILALIVGSAVNQDGATNGLTAPNGLSQQNVIRHALKDAGVDPAQIGYVETHGTGTPLGDPIEVEALAEVLGRAGGEPCVLGSVKTNIGHLEGAAGIAGLIKVVLSLRHGQIPANLNFRRPNPHIMLEGTRLELATSRRPWPAGTDRHAGVSSFGFGGTNAHVVLREAPAVEEVAPEAAAVSTPVLLPLSARSPDALRALAAASAEWLTEASPSLGDLCYTAGARRTHHDHRAAVLGADPAELAERLRAVAENRPEQGAFGGRRPAGGSPALVFVFSDVRAHGELAGSELLDTEPVFRAGVEAVDAALRAAGGPAALDALRAGGQGGPAASVAALFALQVGLSELWRAWGIVPDAVIGEGVGEIAAAYVAGRIDAEAAAAVLRRLATDPRLDAAAALGGAETRTGTVPLYSLTPGRTPEAGARGEPPAAVMELLTGGYTHFLELGPRTGLGSAIRAWAGEHGVDVWVAPSLHRDEPGRPALLATLGALYAAGFDVEWAGLYPTGRVVPMPRYPWQRQSHWFAPGGGGRHAARGAGRPIPLPGRRLRSPVPTFECRLDADLGRFHRHHRVAGQGLVPAAVQLDLALAAAAQVVGDGEHAVEDVAFHEPLVARSGQPRVVHVVLTEEAAGRRFAIYSAPETGNGSAPEWTLHTAGTVRSVAGFGEPERSGPDLKAVRSECPDELTAERFYGALARGGLEVGQPLRSVERIWRGEAQALAWIRPPAAPTSTAAADRRALLLDGALQCCVATVNGGGESGADAYVASGIGRVSVTGNGALASTAGIWCHTRTRRRGNGSGDETTSDLRLFDERGCLVAEIEGLRLRRVGGGRVDAASPEPLLEESGHAAAQRGEGRVPADPE